MFMCCIFINYVLKDLFGYHPLICHCMCGFYSSHTYDMYLVLALKLATTLQKLKMGSLAPPSRGSRTRCTPLSPTKESMLDLSPSGHNWTYALLSTRVHACTYTLSRPSLLRTVSWDCVMQQLVKCGGCSHVNPTTQQGATMTGEGRR